MMDKKVKYALYGGIISIVVISMVYCAIIFWNNNKITEIKNPSWVVDDILKVNIDDFSEKNNNVTLSGWCLKESEDMGYANYYIVVHALSSDKYYKVRTGYQRRDDVTKHWADGYDYGNSGFCMDMDKRNLPSDEYEICLWYCVNNNNIFQNLGLSFDVE